MLAELGDQVLFVHVPSRLDNQLGEVSQSQSSLLNCYSS
jgi:hypothetical protein